MALTVEPFRIDVPEAVLTDLRERLARTRLPEQIDDAGWDYGAELGFVRRLVEHWRDAYDWRAEEARLNAWDHFRTEIDGAGVHFLHARSPEPDALPLVLTHGWPGSFVEFLDVIEPLRDPRAHDADPADAFHVVVPTLPGYGFSGPTHDRGWGPERIARAWAALMAGLGYDRYGAQGGDWGSVVTARLGRVDPDHLAGIHLTMVVTGPPPDGPGELTPTEQQALADLAAYLELDSGYLQIQSTKPQTIGYALDDSPAGLAAWVVEKFRSWSDCAGDVETRFTLDRLCTNLMTYWCTTTAHSAARLYFENRVGGGFGAGGRVEVPTGVAVFPREISRPPRRWVEHAFRLTHWTEMPRGGHFAAMEEPGLFVDDVRAFFRTVR